MNIAHLKKTPSVNGDDKSQETDGEMLIRVGKKFALLSIILLMSDTLFDWIIGLLDLMTEGIHIVIESIEYSIELILENIFQTDHQQSEMIIVNGAIVISLYLAYRLYLFTPKLCSLIAKKWTSYLEHKSSYWHAMPLIRKTKLTCAYCFGISCILFLVTL